jgi:hypothetical protein
MSKGIGRLARELNIPGAKTEEAREAVLQGIYDAAQAHANATSVDQWVIKRGQKILFEARAYLKATDRILFRVPPRTGTRIDDQRIRIM